ncbi:hypothetical protein RUND412_001073 [Rhizina undulata]
MSMSLRPAGRPSGQEFIVGQEEAFFVSEHPEKYGYQQGNPVPFIRLSKNDNVAGSNYVLEGSNILFKYCDRPLEYEGKLGCLVRNDSVEGLYVVRSDPKLSWDSKLEIASSFHNRKSAVEREAEYRKFGPYNYVVGLNCGTQVTSHDTDHANNSDLQLRIKEFIETTVKEAESPEMRSIKSESIGSVSSGLDFSAGDMSRRRMVDGSGNRQVVHPSFAPVGSEYRLSNNFAPSVQGVGSHNSYLPGNSASIVPEYPYGHPAKYPEHVGHSHYHQHPQSDDSRQSSSYGNVVNSEQGLQLYQQQSGNYYGAVGTMYGAMTPTGNHNIAQQPVHGELLPRHLNKRTNELYKTEICRNWSEVGFCRYDEIIENSLPKSMRSSDEGTVAQSETGGRNVSRFQSFFEARKSKAILSI